MKITCFLLLFAGIVNSQGPSTFRCPRRYPDQDEHKVCSRIRDVIPRDSGRFRKILIRNTNNEAQYANDDCRRMTARSKSKLDILASRVPSEWRGQSVRVLRAWTDQVNPNDQTSLHYEGRSLRLQTSDGDRGKLGRLAGLAVEAGFDWVECTNQNYIRASVIPDVCQTSVDLVFLLDGSGSVGKGNFQKEKEFVKKVVDFFNIGTTGTHIGVVQYSTNTVAEFRLDSYYTKSQMKQAVDGIPYQSGWTYTAEALKFLRSHIFTTKAGMRDNVGIPKVLVLLTDGKSQGESVGPPAQALKNIGISIFSIGVGSGVSISQLNEIASDPDSEYVFQRTFDNLIAGWVDRLSAVSCSEGSVINSCDNAVTTVESGSFKYFRTQFQFVTANQVSVELRDVKGISHLYASRTSKNPGPLDPDSKKNEDNTSPKAVSVTVDSTKTVFVAVQGQQDVNEFSLSFWDNLFRQTTFTLSVGENEGAKNIGTLRLATSVYRLKYSIKDGNIGNVFRIDSSRPVLHTIKALDRESIAQYSLVIVAENERNKCHKSRTRVIVTVTDKNDNWPKFTEDPYRATISENTRVQTVVKTVLATDKDSGNNGKITYRITSQSPENRFSINNQGQIRLTESLDYEKHDSYTVGLEARDGGGKTDTSTLEVTVANVNEPPSIRCNVVNCIYSVNENVPTGTGFGAKMEGSDPDTKTTCTLQYSLQSSVRNTFAIAGNGAISTKGKLDREARPSYGFTVTVRDCGGLTDNVYVTVNIKDLNDNQPVFSGPYNVNILESEQPGSNVVQVSARDADEGVNARITYSMSGADSTSFEIDSSNGRITTKSTLDYESKKTYQFDVQARDGGQSVQEGTSKVTVNVLDVNDNKPIFGGPYGARVSEAASRGTNVITVKATDKDSGVRGEIRYSIVGGNIGGAFAVHDRTGVVTVYSNLDRETRSSYKLTVQASDRGSPSLNARTTVEITITDVNDNKPIFQGLPYRRSIPEDFSTSELILKVTATDADAGLYGQVSYSIQSPQIAKDTFKIDSNGNIRLKKALDYETKQAYTFTVKAKDGGDKESSATVDILVEDVNDNTPIFQNTPYTKDVAENVIVGFTVGRVEATDADSGPRGRVSYSILSGNTKNAFRINAAGSVTVASSLDRETTEKYTLTIRAQDEAQPPKQSTATFTITITDINDNKPSFGKDSYSFNIAENNNLNAVVGSLGSATDLDAGLNAEIGYSIVSGNVNAAFEFQANGELIAKKKLDRETTDSYSLVIEARDKGTPSLFTRVPVRVVVTDKNDNTPTFTKNAYSCGIDENSARNSRVCFVRATDNDIGNNGKVVYELVSPSNEFSVSLNGGEIKTKISFDRETTPSYTLQIRAKDLGNPILESVVTVTVRVRDKNDNEPKYAQDYKFEVKEDANLKQKVGRVNATDADEGQNGKVVYAITAGNTGFAFAIDSSTGEISVKSPLDREKLANYKLTIRASDQGSRVLSSSQDVPIKILDVNDNSPIFTSAQYSGKISEDAAIGSSVVQVKAKDADEGVNSQVKYSITGGEQKEHFSIDEDSGFINTATKLDFESKESYSLTVTATDQGTPTRTGTSQVKIDVKNTNDNIPTFVPGSPVVHVSEAVAIGTKVVQFNATDDDGNTLSFSISKGNTDSSFAINMTSGLLTTNKNLDREKIPYYNITVTVTEVTNNTKAAGQSSSQNLSVIVTDENDNAPVFKPETYSKAMDENTPAGVILTVSATDADEGKNAEISFTLDTVSEKKFNIDSKTGEISTKEPLDHEERPSYDVTVTARDAGTPSLSSTATVKVTVNDLNDNKPGFSSNYTTTLLENTAKGENVLRVEASDPDSGANGEVIYSIRSGNDLGYFELNTATGIISVAKPPDREQNPSFTLSIHAANTPAFAPSTPAAKTDCNVVITIGDANDNPPNITNTVTTVKVEENSPTNTQVLDVDATDADDGVNGQIEYEIIEGNINNVFTIDRDSGVISTRGAIDRETIAEYTLKIQASDKGSPVLFSTKDFVVAVSDLDDNAPVFNPAAYDETVLESVNVSTLVVSLLATDKDIGKNAKLSFSITSGNDEGHFRIDSDTGKIYTNALLDYEKITDYNLVVTAKDTKHTTRANVAIHVANINDNAPVFLPRLYKLSIPENQTLDKAIVTVSASDADPFGGITYSLVLANNMFTVDPASGKISVVSKLDRETTDFYNFTVRATDGGSPALFDHAIVEIRITDINDNNPIFNSSQEDISVLENSRIGKVLLKVAATDADLGRNADVRYTIAGGNEENKFKLDAVSGNLSVLANIDREKIDAFRLKIVAQDLGRPQLTSAPFVVDVRVLDENDNDPVFTHTRYEQNITENLSDGLFVQEVEAIDADIGDNGRVTYAILSGAEGYFRINNDTGIVETTKALDREDIASFLITIEARDQGNPSRNSTALLRVNVVDLNDNSPSLDTVIANVTEEQPKGEFVTRIVAIDSDQGMNGEVEYSLTIRGNQSLKINPKTGVITTRVKFDYEEQRNHNFKIIATDKGNPPLSTIADLIINVLDIDDNCPKFDPKEYNVTIEENLPFLTDIVEVFAKDVDTVGDQLDYGIRSVNIAPETFTIDRKKGIIKAGRSVDREVSSEYNLVVRAGNDYCGVNRTGEDTDESVESKLSKSIAKVNVFLTDLNDNAPVFLQDSYEYELTDIYTSSLMWLNASDPDEGINSEFDFGFHGETRVGQKRTLIVTATDKGTPSMTSNTTLDVTGVKCEAMHFSVSSRGHVTVKTLCRFDKVVVPESAFVEQSATFNCSAQGNTNPEYRWSRNSVPITDWLKTGEYFIQSLTKNDDGRYSCVASSDAGNILSASHKFFVKEPAKVVVHPEDIWVEVGKKTSLSCRASGDKPVTYKWYKNNVLVTNSAEVTADQADLIFHEAILADAQVYHCVVSNYPDAKPHKSRTARLEVYTPDAVVDMELTVNKPRQKESCQYFNMTNIEESIEILMKGKMAVVEYEKPPQLCNLTACSSDPCMNNGRCETKGSGFECKCPREWTGLQCEIDVNECESETCGKNGVCENRKGSFSCKCGQSASGKLCQLNETLCNPNPCQSGKCYPKEVRDGYECLADVTTVTMVYTLGEERIPLEDWMLYDVAKEIENTINNAAVVQTREGGRTRRAPVTVDYSDCFVRVTDSSVNGKDLRLDIILVCAKPPSQKYVCDAMFEKNMVTSCTDESGTREPKPKTDPPTIEAERVKLAFIVRNTNGKDEEASATVSVLNEGNIKEELKKYNMYDVSLRARSRKNAESGESGSDLSSGTIAGVVVGIIVLVAVALVILAFVLRRRRGDGKEFSIGGRAILSRTQSTDAIITRDINLRELENAEARGVNNKTFSEIYEENDGNVEDGSFMVANPQLALKNNELEYMKELETAAWYHGSITRSKAEDLLDATEDQGTFLVRSGMDMGEFYISVRTPNAEPKFRHICVNRRGESFVAMCESEAQNFATFNELVEYLRANPTKMEGISEEVILKDHISKV